MLSRAAHRAGAAENLQNGCLVSRKHCLAERLVQSGSAGRVAGRTRHVEIDGDFGDDRRGNGLGQALRAQRRVAEQREHDAERWRAGRCRDLPVQPHQHAGNIRPQRLAHPFQLAPAAIEGSTGLRARRVDGAALVGQRVATAVALGFLQLRIVDRQRDAADVARAAGAAGDQVGFGRCVRFRHRCRHFGDQGTDAHPR